MPRSRQVFLVTYSLLLCSGVIAAAQTSGPVTTPDLPEALARVTDYAFDFAQPGFYALLDELRRDPLAPPCDVATEVNDWRVLLDRSSQFRGVPLIIEGVVRRNTAWQHLRADLAKYGAVWELQLQHPGQPLIVKVVLTQIADDLPLGATVRVCGYFLMIQQYYSESNQLRQAAILVARAPLTVTFTEPVAQSPGALLTPAVAAIVIGIGIAWWLLRRAGLQEQRESQS